MDVSLKTPSSDHAPNKGHLPIRLNQGDIMTVGYLDKKPIAATVAVPAHIEGTHTNGKISLPENAAQIQRVSVIPDARGNGYGSILLRELIQVLVEEGKTPVLQARYDDSRGDRTGFYTRLGFVPVKVEGKPVIIENNGIGNLLMVYNP